MISVEVLLEDFFATLDAMAWCRENCPSYISRSRYLVVGRGTVDEFNFNDEKDATMFALRWS